MILASGSKARLEMLCAAGVEMQAHPARIDEQAVKAAMLHDQAPPRDIADALAELKARRVSSRFPGELVLGADQVLVCDGVLYDKATSMEEAHQALLSLCGKVHQLISAAVIVKDEDPVWRHIGTARLNMRPFTETFLESYLAAFGEDALSSVGAYHLERLGAQLFSRIEGDYFTILGLPLLEVLGFLRARGELIE